jgi:hypothetical protein
MNPNITRTHPQAISTREKMGQVMQLRKQGYTFAAISDTLGISVPYAHKLAKHAMMILIQEPAADLLTLELERLDALMLPAFQAATQLDENGQPIFDKEASLVVLKIMERRAKYFGLDKPVKIETKAIQNKTVQVYLPDNGRGDTGMVINNESQEVEDPIDMAIMNSAAELDMGDIYQAEELIFEDEEEYED